MFCPHINAAIWHSVICNTTSFQTWMPSQFPATAAAAAVTYDLEQRIHTRYTTSQSTGVKGVGQGSEPRPQLLPEEFWKKFKAFLLDGMMSQQGVMCESSAPQMWLCLLHVPFLHKLGWGHPTTHSVSGPGLGWGAAMSTGWILPCLLPVCTLRGKSSQRTGEHVFRAWVWA